MSEKDVYKELLLDKTHRAKALVEKAKGIVGIDDDTGEPIILVSRARLTDKLIVSLYLCGKFFSSELGLVDTPSATLDELSGNLGLEKDSVSARLSELKKEGKIRTIERGKYEVVSSLIIAILDEVRSKL